MSGEDSLTICGPLGSAPGCSICERCKAETLLAEAEFRESALQNRINFLETAMKQLCKGLPSDIAPVYDHLMTVGLEWGATDPKSDEAHCKDFADTLRLTREEFQLGDEDRALEGVYLAGTETVFCHTGTSPNSGMHARMIVGFIQSTHRIRQYYQEILSEKKASPGFQDEVARSASEVSPNGMKSA